MSYPYSQPCAPLRGCQNRKLIGNFQPVQETFQKTVSHRLATLRLPVSKKTKMLRSKTDILQSWLEKATDPNKTKDQKPYKPADICRLAELLGIPLTAANLSKWANGANTPQKDTILQTILPTFSTIITITHSEANEYTISCGRERLTAEEN